MTPENKSVPSVMSVKFTSGPWHVDDKEPGFTLNRLLIKSETTHQTAICALNFHADPDECRANAALIKSAPEMYSSLKDMVLTVTDLLEAICSGEENTDCLFAVVYDEIDNAIQVLKKARGEE